ncbi:hypothetical protein BGZ73_007317, partial [Actinomortierella ambigua]
MSDPSDTSLPSPSSQHTTVVQIDLPADPPSYDNIITTTTNPLAESSTSSPSPLLHPAPAYDHYNYHRDDLLRSLAVPSAPYLPHYQHQRLPRSPHASSQIMDELPGYVALDLFEPPWTLSSGRCIKYTVLAHQEAGQFTEEPNHVGSGGTSGVPGGAYLHDVVIRQPPVPRMLQRRIRGPSTSSTANNTNNTRSAAAGSQVSDDSDEGDDDGQTPSVVYKRTSAWALEYWCEDTIMYLYFPVKLPEAEEETQRQQEQQQNDHEQGTEGFRTQPQSLNIVIPPGPAAGAVLEDAAHTDLPPPEQHGSSSSVNQAITAHRHPPFHPTASQVSDSRTTPTTSPWDTNRPRTKPCNIIPTFALVAANDPMAGLWTSRIDDKLVEYSLQTSSRDQVLLHWRVRGGGTGEEKISGDGVIAGCLHELDTVWNWIRDLPIWQRQWWGWCWSWTTMTVRRRMAMTRASMQRQNGTRGPSRQWTPPPRPQRVQSYRREKEKLLNTKARLLRLRQDCEIMFRVRGQHFAWRDVTHEKLTSPPSTSTSTSTSTPSQPAMTQLESIPMQPPSYQPRAMTIQSPLPTSAAHLQQLQAASIASDVEMAANHHQAPTLPPANIDTTPTTTTTTAVGPATTTTPSNARMFALYRDDHFDVDKKRKGYIVAEVWVVEEKQENDNVTSVAEEENQRSETEAEGNPTSTITTANDDDGAALSLEGLAPLDPFPDNLRRRKCMIRIKQNLNHDMETFVLTTGPRLPDLFDRIPRRSPVTSGHTLLYASLLMSLFMGWGLFFLTKKDLGW